MDSSYATVVFSGESWIIVSLHSSHKILHLSALFYLSNYLLTHPYFYHFETQIFPINRAQLLKIYTTLEYLTSFS
jgi:hypothetical protein